MTVRQRPLLPSSLLVPFRRGLLAAAMAALLASLAPSPAAGQSGIITGQVVDAESGAPVNEALVELLSGGRERVAFTNCDAEGRFRFTDAPSGTFSLVFSRLGYEIRRMDGIAVGLAPIDVGRVTLVSRALRMNPIVVTPSRTEEKALKAPASTYVVSTQDVEARPATSSVEHVRSVPGVDVASSGLVQHSVTARGFNNVFSGSLMVLTDNRWASVPSLRVNTYGLIPTTNEDIERIEMVLGPGSALYGPNVANGVMHILTHSPLVHQGTTLSGLVGERDVAQLSGRHASRIGERVGFKLSGNFFHGRDWEYRDPVEQAQRAAALGAGARPDTLRIGLRDDDVLRFGGEGRVDARIGDRTDLVLSSGFSQMGTGIELTGLGAVQAKDWRYTYVQARLRHEQLFVQSYINFSDAGESYLLRDGARLKDNSLVVVGQAQHSKRFGERQRFIYGADAIRTLPRTDGTITGRNENDDDITEVGGYAQSETRLHDRLDLVAAARLDDHSRVSDVVFSPRAGFLWRPVDGHNLRLTYNRAFNQVTSNNLFLDLVSARNFGGLPYDVRVTGVPKDGFHFARDVGGRPLMRSPFTPGGLGGPAQQLPLDATIFWGVVQSAVPALAGTPAPTAAQVGTVMRALNPTTRAFNTVSDVRDVDALKPQITNTAEVGYKGFVANRLSLGLDLYFSRIEDFVSPLLVPTPNVFLDRASLTAYLVSQGFTPLQAATIAAGVAGIDGNPSVTGLPLGTVTPTKTVGDPFDLFLTYRNFGTVDMWGADFGATLLATDQLSFTGTYSLVSKNLFKNQDGIADIALNAPINKATLAANYRNAKTGLSLELRGRYVDRFPMNSGVFVGDVDAYTLLDANVSYSLPFSPGTDASLSGTNVFDDRHREFIGAPELGRMLVFRIRHTL